MLFKCFLIFCYEDDVCMIYEQISLINLMKKLAQQFNVEIRVKVVQNYIIEYIEINNKTLQEILNTICELLKIEYTMENNIIYVFNEKEYSINYQLLIKIDSEIKKTINEYLEALKISYIWNACGVITITTNAQKHQQIENYINHMNMNYNKQIHISLKVVQISTHERNSSELNQICTNLFKSINEFNTTSKSRVLLNYLPLNQLIAGASGVFEKHKENENVKINFECSGNLYIQNKHDGYMNCKSCNNTGFDCKIHVDIISDNCINLNISHKYTYNALSKQENNEINTTLTIEPNKIYIISSQSFKIKCVSYQYFFNDPILKTIFFFLNNRNIIHKLHQYFIILETSFIN